MIISASINSDGTIVRAACLVIPVTSLINNDTQRLDRAVAAGGRGLHGISATGAVNGSDGLFSQGSIQVSAANNVLATVNVSVASMGLT